jgi:hypothetical protein
MKKARLIITFDCPRHCSYCCNSYLSLMGKIKTIEDVSEVYDYDEIILTGGEVGLYEQRTKELIDKIRKNSKAKIYMYTAMWKDWMKDILTFLDGLHYTLHENATLGDVGLFYKFQEAIREFQGMGKSFRLYMFPSIKFSVNIVPYLYARIEGKPWIPEGELILPEFEELIYLREKKVDTK